MAHFVADSPSGYLTLQFLAWIGERSPTYGETMEGWQTSCPRLSIWEDALIDELVRLEDGHGRGRRVVLTERGKALLVGIDGQGRRASEPRAPSNV